MQNENFKTIHVELEYSVSHYDFYTIIIEFPHCFRQAFYKVVIKDSHELLRPCFFFSRRSLSNLFIRHYKGRHSLLYWQKLYQRNSQYHYEYVIKLLHDSALSKVKVDAPESKQLDIMSELFQNLPEYRFVNLPDGGFIAKPIDDEK